MNLKYVSAEIRQCLKNPSPNPSKNALYKIFLFTRKSAEFNLPCLSKIPFIFGCKSDGKTNLCKTKLGHSCYSNIQLFNQPPYFCSAKLTRFYRPVQLSKIQLLQLQQFRKTWLLQIDLTDA